MKNGSRLKSRVDDTQVIIVRSADSLTDLRCGGVPMANLADETETVAPSPDFTDGTTLGKRYVSADGAEVLVTKAGTGTLSIGTTPLTVKEAQPLPASD